MGPISNMLFRPEEIHCASGVGSVFKPLPKGHSHVSHQTLRLDSKDLTIADLHPNRKPTIETGSVDPNCFSWKEPADRQRFERSLAKPFLLALNRYPVLSGKIVEWCKGSDVVRIRK
jgi:hypothetical protein